MIEIRISDEAKSCADRIMANFISSGANASTAFIAAQAIEKLLNQRDAELAELRKDKERLDWIVENFGNVDLQSRNSHGKILNHFSWIHTMPEAICTLREAIDSAMMPTASQAVAKGGEK